MLVASMAQYAAAIAPYKLKAGPWFLILWDN
jgi:hypothetical protein